ncbi:MAG TPA: hypothetical protein VF954_03845 [Acidimicrobiales bacterium]
MTRLAGRGLALELPVGWEGHIYRRAEDGSGSTQPVMHVASFPLPAARGDFGGGAVERMGPDDVFVALLEFHPSSAGAALFSSPPPAALGLGDFAPSSQQTFVEGNSAAQRFFSVGDRAFCLYAVIGSHARRTALVPLVNRVLSGLAVTPLDRLGGSR